MRIIELVEDDENYYIVSELLKGGELFKRLLTCRSFTELQASQIVLHMLEGLNYMHLQCVTHRDLKPENILLVSERKDVFDIKLADLGFAQKFEKDKGLDLVLGTPLYMAPELVRQQRYTEKVDVWSLGCIVYQLRVARLRSTARASRRSTTTFVRSRSRRSSRILSGAPSLTTLRTSSCSAWCATMRSDRLSLTFCIIHGSRPSRTWSKTRPFSSTFRRIWLSTRCTVTSRRSCSA